MINHGVLTSYGQLRPLVGGRSNYVWQVQGVKNCVLKLYNLGSRNPLFANDPDREIASLKSLSGTAMAPQLLDVGIFEGQRWILYAHVPGSTWRQNTCHVAQLLGRLHNQPILETLPTGPNGSRQLEDATWRILQLCSETSRSQILAARPTILVPPIGRTSFIHGDPVPGNIVEHDGTLTLIDWQCPVLGDPCEDLAVFTSPAMQLLYRNGPLDPHEETKFFQAYPDRQVIARYHLLKPWYRWRMAAYCLWKTQQGQDEYLAAMHLELDALGKVNQGSI